MMNARKILAAALVLLLLSLCAVGEGDTGWYCPQCRRYNEASYRFCPKDGTKKPEGLDWDDQGETDSFSWWMDGYGDDSNEIMESLPQLPWEGSAAYMNSPYIHKKYVRPQCGPGAEYQVFQSMNGKKHLYNPDEMTRADICFTTGNWAYVGFGYSDGKWRYGFFRKDVFSPYDGWSSVPEIPLDVEWRGTVNAATIPYNGPYWDGGSYESCKLHRGDTVYACMEYDGWYLCRFYNDHDNKYGYVYLWVPGSSISW